MASTAYNQGAATYLAGGFINHNPYGIDTFEHFQWNKGFSNEQGRFKH